jgi:hypothetical protein
VKWLLVLLVFLGGGVAWAAFAVPTNAAVVNGSAISQASLNSDVHAIAGSAEYQCYLNSQDYLSSNGSATAGLPPVSGAGKGQNEGDNPTATSAFVATYLDTVIGHELVEQLAAKRNVTVDSAQLADARASLTSQITGVMQQVAQTAQGQNPKFSCGAVSPLTGQQVLGSLPSWFVDGQVQFVATASALQEDLAGVGSSEANLQSYYARHHAQFDTVCFNAAEYTDQASAQAAQAAVNFGTPFSQVASSATQSGTIPCTELVAVAGELGTSISTLEGVAVGKASAPINVNGNYVVLELSKRTPTPYATAKPVVSQAVQEVGARATQAAITNAERRASVSVDPRYGTWVPVNASVFTPLTPEPSSVLNASANEPTVSTSTSPFSG